MSKIQTVRLLQAGDQFEFLDVGAATHLQGTMVVTRPPKVNPAAGSCFFRYRPAALESAEMHSWNGPPEGQVRLIGGERCAAETVTATADTAANAAVDTNAADELPEPTPSKRSPRKSANKKAVAVKVERSPRKQSKPARPARKKVDAAKKPAARNSGAKKIPRAKRKTK